MILLSGSDGQQAFDVVLWVLIGAFWATLALVLARTLWLFCREEPGWRVFSVRKASHALLLPPLLLRALDMTIFRAGYLQADLRQQSFAAIALGGAPGYAFFAVVSLLFCFWAALLSPRAAEGRRRFARLFFALNAAVLVCWAALLLGVGLAPTVRAQTAAHTAELVFAAALAAVSALFFLAYGLRIYRRIVAASPAAPATPKTLAIARRIGALTAAFSATMLARAIIILVDWFVAADTHRIVPAILKTAFQLLLELAPTIATIVILFRPISVASSSSSSSSSSSFSSSDPLLHARSPGVQRV